SVSPVLIILGALPWLLLLLHQIFRRGFTVLLVWLFIAPVATNLLQRTETDDQGLIYETSGTAKDIYDKDFYYEQPAAVTWQKLLNPTRTLLGLLLMVFVLNALLKKTPWIPLNRTEKYMGIFSLILLSNVFLWSARLGFGLTVAVDAFITPFVAYFLARRFVINEYRFVQLVRVIGYMGVYVILFCLVERLTTLDMFYRLRGPFESANTLHPVLAVAFFVAWINPVYEGRQSLPNPIRWAILSIVPIVVGVTLTRGNWVGFLSAFAIFLILARRLERFPRTAQKIGLILIIPLILGLSLANLIPENLLEERVMDGENILGRFATWIATLRIALTSPFFGVGLNNLYGLLSIDIVT